jgi:hypothetical protein
MDDPSNQARYYRRMSETLLALGSSTMDPEARHDLAEMAIRFDRLAKYVERKRHREVVQ